MVANLETSYKLLLIKEIILDTNDFVVSKIIYNLVNIVTNYFGL